jgi:hypothetical protein
MPTRCRTREAFQWWQQWTAEDGTMQNVKEMEGYDEMVKKFVNGLTLEQRLAGLPPEQRLLAMPDDALRALSDEYLRSLPAATQDAIRARIGRPSA